MVEWVQTLTRLEQTFFVCAAVGSVFFLIQLVLLSLGGGDAGTDVGADAGGHIGDGTLGGDADLSAAGHPRAPTWASSSSPSRG